MVISTYYNSMKSTFRSKICFLFMFGLNFVLNLLWQFLKTNIFSFLVAATIDQTREAPGKDCSLETQLLIANSKTDEKESG